MELLDVPHKEVGNIRIRSAYSDTARCDVFSFLKFFFRMVQHIEGLFYYFEHLLPSGIGQFDPAADPVKKLPAELSFKLFYRLRNGRLRNI